MFVFTSIPDHNNQGMSGVPKYLYNASVAMSETTEPETLTEHQDFEVGGHSHGGATSEEYQPFESGLL